jgi:hypothetical protein
MLKVRSATGVNPALASRGPQSAPRWGVLLGRHSATACFKAWAAKADVIGQEARQRLHLGDGDQPAGTDTGEDFPQCPVRVGQMVQGHGRPDHVGRSYRRPRAVQVGLEGADPAVQAEVHDLDLDPGEHLGGCVHGEHLGAGEPLGKGDGRGPGTAAQIDDPVPGPVRSLAGDPCDRAGQIAVQYLGVKLQKLGQGVPRVSFGTGMVMCTGMMIVVVHVVDPTAVMRL